MKFNKLYNIAILQSLLEHFINRLNNRYKKIKLMMILSYY